jgi:transposase
VLGLKADKQNANKDIILLIDNAVIHKHSLVLETAKNLRVNVLFNAEYSPWLNPVEQLFGFIKKQVKSRTVDNKYASFSIHSI